MDRKIILAGAFVVAIAGASAVAFAGIGRGASTADIAAIDPNRPLQTLLSQVQSQGIPPSAVTPLTQVLPIAEPAQVAQAPTPVADATPVATAAQPQPTEAPTVTPGADSPTPVTTATVPTASQSRFVPTSGPMPSNQPSQRTRIVRQVASGAMCN